MTDKSAVELGAFGQVFPSSVRLLCDFHRSQAWERWVSKSTNDINPQLRSDVLEQLKKLAYAPTSMLIILLIVEISVLVQVGIAI